MIECQCLQIVVGCDPDETGAIDLKAGMGIDPAPRGKLKKLNDGCDDRRSLIFSMCYWNILSMTHDSFVLLTL